jgi:hypothetical protein
MADERPQDHISRKRVLYTVPGMDRVTVMRDLVYRTPDGTPPLTMDVYLPPDSTPDARHPAVILVTGYTDAGAQKMLGCRWKDMGSFVSWAQLAAASGVAAVTYVNQEPAADARAVIEYVRTNAARLMIDETRVGVWGCSGHGPTALATLMHIAPRGLRCAALCYPLTLDLEGSTRIADAAAQFRFVNACAGKSMNDLSRDAPLLVVRAGADETPGLNEALDAMVARGLALDLPITLINHAGGVHAFDLSEDSAPARHVVADVLRFLAARLAPAPAM